MRYAPVVLILECVGCRAIGLGSACDDDALVRLSADLADATASEQERMVVPGLEAACADSLPPIMFVYDEIDATERTSLPTLEDTRPIKLRACPDVDDVMRHVATVPAHQRALAVYQGCNFERHGVIDRTELAGGAPSIVTWAMHQWLLDQGLDPDQARPITRALYGLELRQSYFVRTLPGQTLPKAAGDRLQDGVTIGVSPTELIFNEMKLATLTNGVLDPDEVQNHLIRRLFEALVEEADKDKQMAEAQGSAWAGRVILALDHNTPFSTVAELMYTAGRAGYSNYAFFVEGNHLGGSQIPVSLPHFSVNGSNPQVGGMMTIEVTRDAVTLSQGGEYGEPPTTVSTGDDDAIAGYARDLVKADPKAHRVLISAEADVPLRRLLSVIAAARGSDCDSKRTACILPDVTITDEGAHRVPAGGYIVETVPRDVPSATTGGMNGRGERVPRVQQMKATVKGDVDRDFVRRIVRSNLGEVRSCYGSSLTRDPTLEGKLVIRFTITASGKVRDPVVQENTLKDKELGTCTATAVEKWKFPKPEDEGEVTVTYPFRLSPG